MNRAMTLVFLSCQKATELVERKIHFGKLSPKEQVQLKFHNMICKYCALYEKQSVLIGKGIAANNKNKFKEADLDELKQLILQKLDDLNHS